MVRNGTALPLTLRKQMFPAPSPGMRNQGGATMEEDRQWAAQKLAFDLGMQFRDAWKSSRKIGISGGSCGSGAPARGCWSATANGLTEGPARPFPSLAHPISKCTGGEAGSSETCKIIWVRNFRTPLPAKRQRHDGEGRHAVASIPSMGWRRGMADGGFARTVPGHAARQTAGR